MGMKFNSPLILKIVFCYANYDVLNKFSLGSLPFSALYTSALKRVCILLMKVAMNVAVELDVK